MAIKKESLNNFLPDGFETLNQEGYKENFSADKISTGYEKDVPDIVSGPNLNNLIDVIGKNTNTLNSYVEYLNSLSVNKTPIVDSNNQLNSTQIGLKVYSATETYLLNDLVTTIQDGKVHFYRSLVANNTGHDLTDEQYWEEVKLGGSGLELCDIGMALYVDETKGLRRYLNGQIVDRNTNTEAFFTRLQQITTLHPSLLCTEEEWQTAKTMSAFGQVGKFVFNYNGADIVSVRIPRVVNVQGLFDLQNLGMTVSAGLPTHTHTRGTMEISGNIYTIDGGGGSTGADGAFAVTGQSQNHGRGTNNSTHSNVNFYASRSWTGSTSVPDNSIYGASNTVQQEAIQYPYFIQIATGSETENNIINDIELNNPYSLFDSKYSDHELNNLSWLKSEGQWNAKAVYPSAYDELLREYNSPDRLATFNKDAFTVVGSPTITDDGVASGFSSSNYINTGFKLADLYNKKWVIKTRTVYKYLNNNGAFGVTLMSNYGGTQWLIQGNISVNNSDKAIIFFGKTIGGAEGAKITITNTETNIKDGDIIDLDLSFDLEKYTLKAVINNSTTITKSWTPTTDDKNLVGTQTSGTIYINSRHGGGSLTDSDCQIDLKKFSITVDGVKVFSGAKSKVKLSTEEYTDYDFVLNTADETFRLPLKTLHTDDTVDSLSLYYYVGETVQNANLIDAGRIGEQLATKTDMLQASGAGMPSNRYIDLTLGASGSTYTAPANGYFSVGGNFGNVNGYFTLALRDNASGHTLLLFEPKATSGSYSCYCWAPAKKGDVVIANYNYSPFSSTASGTPFFRFIYAEGSQPTT